MQCVILVGGRGTRLGRLVDDCPKPLLPVGNRPFLAYLIENLARFGFDDFVLLAGYQGDVVAQFARAGVPICDDANITIRVIVEPEPLGTAGALRNACDILAPRFLMLNGDCFFDFNFLDLAMDRDDGDWLARIALRHVEDASRYGVVTLASGGRVVAMKERPDEPGQGVINGGIYWMCRDIVREIPSGECSIEKTVFPDLAARGLLRGAVYPGVFLDIGVPDDYAASQQLIPSHRLRPAIFFDRDGVLNHDDGYTHTIEEFRWISGAGDAIRAVNDAGWFAFVVTNQAGVARGLYGEDDVRALHRWMNDELRSKGAHIDAFRYCPYHVDGVVEQFTRRSDWRKPAPGMLLDIADHWPVDRSRSLLIGDKDSDLDAARRAGVMALKYGGTDLLGLTRSAIGAAKGDN